MIVSLIRRAEPGDVPALHALIERAYRGDSARKGWTHEADLLGGQRTDPDALHEILADADSALLVMESDGEMLGCVHVKRIGEGAAYIGLVTVDPARQAGGTGRALLAEAEAHAAQAMGARRAEMTVLRQRPELIAWYERRGYAITGEERPFPLDDPRFGLPRTRDLAFVVLEKAL